MPPDSSKEILALVQLVVASKHTVALTGAGISTESGIPDYRGPNGVWSTGRAPRLDKFLSSLETRRQYWIDRRSRYPTLRETEPNPGHQALADLQSLGLLAEIITQNIDGLHQKAGSAAQQIIELHGTAHRVRCLDCHAFWPAEEIQRRLPDVEIPSCEFCGGMLRAATVLFGEPLPQEELRRAVKAAEACELMIVIGSSLVVRPAASLPMVARSSGAKLAVINAEPTPIDEYAAVTIHASSGETLQQLLNLVLVAQG
jgi:NAD-dependent deacetylase